MSTDKQCVKTMTFGCRLNTYESQVMQREAQAAGLKNAILVNTCAVTGEAVRQAKQAIRRARKENPDTRIIVSGCAAQTDPASFGDMEEVDLVIGNDDKLKSQSYRALPEFGINQYEKVRVNDIFEVRETASHMVDCIEGRARAFVQIQNGCDHRCTFCIIPYGRGKSRSVPAGGVIAQIKRLVDHGYREVVLTGVDTTSYGADLPGNQSLGTLVQKILTHIPDLTRLRLSSIDSIEVDQALIDVISSDERFMPHLHLSLQSGDNMILKRMKRRHLREHTVEFCQMIRSIQPNMAFGADIIAGFPTETDEMFENTRSIIQEIGIAYCHIFPFSPRPGTPAALMPQLEKSIIKKRAAELRLEAAKAFEEHCHLRLESRQSMLLERQADDGSWSGHSADFTPLKLLNAHNLVSGQIVEVKPYKIFEGVMLVEIL